MTPFVSWRMSMLPPLRRGGIVLWPPGSSRATPITPGNGSIGTATRLPMRAKPAVEIPDVQERAGEVTLGQQAPARANRRPAEVERGSHVDDLDRPACRPARAPRTETGPVSGWPRNGPRRQDVGVRGCARVVVIGRIARVEDHGVAGIDRQPRRRGRCSTRGAPADASSLCVVGMVRRHVVPDHHAGAGAPRDGRHVGEHIGRPPREREDEDPGEELGGAAGARGLHPLERAFAQQGVVVTALEQIEKPAVELLVHPEVARAAGLVRETAGGDHRDALASQARP